MSTSTRTTSTNERSGAAVSPFRLVKLDTGKLIHATAKADDIYGATGCDGQDAADLPLTIYTSGILTLTAGAAITKGALIMASTAGKVITHDDSATAKFIGYALEAAGADGDQFLCVLYDDKRRIKPAA